MSYVMRQICSPFRETPILRITHYALCFTLHTRFLTGVRINSCKLAPLVIVTH